MSQLPSASEEYLKPVPVTMPVARRYHLNVLLFGLTVLSTLFWGAYWMVVHEATKTAVDPWVFLQQVLQHPAILYKGIGYAGAIMLILLAHEMGTLPGMRPTTKIDATLPFFYSCADRRNRNFWSFHPHWISISKSKEPF